MLTALLNPLVDKLNVLWQGIKVKTRTSPIVGSEISVVLMCYADIPTAHKLCGLVGLSVNSGCLHCGKFFLGGVGEKDYSRFDRSTWPKRTDDSH